MKKKLRRPDKTMRIICKMVNQTNHLKFRVSTDDHCPVPFPFIDHSRNINKIHKLKLN